MQKAHEMFFYKPEIQEFAFLNEGTTGFLLSK